MPERSRKFSLPGGQPAFAPGWDDQPVIEDDEAQLRAEIEADQQGELSSGPRSTEIEADQQGELSAGARMPVEHDLLVNQVLQMAVKASEADLVHLPVHEPNYDPLLGCMNEQDPSAKRTVEETLHATVEAKTLHATVEAKTLHARLQHARLQQGKKHVRSAPVLTYFPVGEVEGDAEGEYQAWREARRTAEGKMNELLRRERHSHTLALSQKRAIAQHNLDRSRLRFAGRQQGLQHSLAELRRAKARPSGPTLATAAHKPAILGAPGGDWFTSVRGWLMPSYTKGRLCGSSQPLSLIADSVDASVAQTSTQASTRPTRPHSAGGKAASATGHSSSTSSLLANRPQSAGILPSQRSTPLLRPQSALRLGLVTVSSAQHAAQPRYSAGVRAMITAVQPSPGMRAAPSVLPAPRMLRSNTNEPASLPHKHARTARPWLAFHGVDYMEMGGKAV